jgi:hypothetical protein
MFDWKNLFAGWLLSELSKQLPSIAKHLIKWSTRRLPLSERDSRCHEYLAVVEGTEGELAKLLVALDFVFGMWAIRDELTHPAPLSTRIVRLFNTHIVQQFPQSRTAWISIAAYAFFGIGLTVATPLLGIPISSNFALIFFLLPLGISLFGCSVVCASGMYQRIHGYDIGHGKEAILFGYNISRFGFGLHCAFIGTIVVILSLLEPISQGSTWAAFMFTALFVALLPISLFGNIIGKSLLDWKAAKKLKGIGLIVFNLFEFALIAGTFCGSWYAIQRLILVILS